MGGHVTIEYVHVGDIVWSYYVQMMGYREIIVTKSYLVSKEVQLYSL